MNADKALELARKAYPNNEELSVAYMLGLNEGYELHKDEMMKDAVEKKGVVWDDEFVKFDDGTFLDFRDPTLNNRPAFVLPNNGERVKIIIVKED